MNKEIEQNKEESTLVNNDEKTIIKHIVCSGGGIAGFAFYGAIKECYNQGLWHIDNIETIYGTSIGTFLAVVLALKYDWKTLDDYLIKRPWQNVFKFNLYTIIESLQRRGIFGREVIVDFFLPLFNGKDISIDITMLELYELTKIEIHMFATEINNFNITDISYKTHPDWKVIDAVYSSSAIPIIFSPLLKDDMCYCDGALFTNYPLNECISNGAKPEEIIGLRYVFKNQNIKLVNLESSLFDYVMTIIKKLIGTITIKKSYKIAHEICINSPSISIYDIINTTSDINERIRLIQHGKDSIKLNLTISS
jgi:predicted acylesterase/phospholipase RssA